jgi:hypothetical protein
MSQASVGISIHEYLVDLALLPLSFFKFTSVRLAPEARVSR